MQLSPERAGRRGVGIEDGAPATMTGAGSRMRFFRDLRVVG